MKSVLTRSFSGAHFPSFGLNTDKYFVSLCIQYDCRKIQTRKTPSTDTFHAVIPEVHSEPCQTSKITRFLISNTIISNARLKLAKKPQANAKQHPEAEFFASENYSHSLSTLPTKNNRTYSKK